MAGKPVHKQLTNFGHAVSLLDENVVPSMRLIHDILLKRWPEDVRPCDSDTPQEKAAKRSQRIEMTKWAVEQTLRKAIPDVKELNHTFDEDDINPVVDILKNMQGKKDDQAIEAAVNTAGTAT